MFHILVIDDDKNTRRLMRAVLEGDGYTVTTACDGEEALSVMDREHIDLAVLDIMMPRMNGLEATHLIRGTPERADLRTLPILAMSANAFAEDVKKSLEAGMNGHLSKPIEMDKLLEALNRVLGG